MDSSNTYKEQYIQIKQTLQIIIIIKQTSSNLKTIMLVTVHIYDDDGDDDDH